jgi:hypothetical protein
LAPIPGNSPRIAGGYTQAANDSPLSDGNGGYQGGGTAGTTVNTTSTAGPYSGTFVGLTSSSPGGPIWNGGVPSYKSAASFAQWFSDDATVNKTFFAVLELSAIGSGVYQYASQVHLAQGGFFPLDTLNPSQATLCDLWPYWNHGNGTPIWSNCQGDQYLFPPYVVQSDCTTGDSVADGCWVIGVAGVKHDYDFTMEAHYYFAYDPNGGPLTPTSAASHLSWRLANPSRWLRRRGATTCSLRGPPRTRGPAPCRVPFPRRSPGHRGGRPDEQLPMSPAVLRQTATVPCWVSRRVPDANRRAPAPRRHAAEHGHLLPSRDRDPR